MTPTTRTLYRNARLIDDSSDLFKDPHLHARELVKTIDHNVVGSVQVLGWPARMSDRKVEIKAAPLLREHTAEVFAEDCELSSDQIVSLRKKGAIG